MTANTLGDAPIEDALREKMNKLGRRLASALNETATKEQWGFVLMVFPLNDHEGRCNYISNAEREDVVTLLREQLRRFEGAPDVTGHA